MTTRLTIEQLMDWIAGKTTLRTCATTNCDNLTGPHTDLCQECHERLEEEREMRP